MLKYTVAAAAFIVSSVNAHAAEGDGKYAYDCAKPETVVEITMTTIASGAAATVRYGGKSYPQLMADYASYGRMAPPDFLVSIMFNRGQSPLPNKTRDGVSYLEIWRAGSGYYLLENGNKAFRLKACSR